ncbi:VUT family protein [bacterium]|nr:VUT family protein [bacterium]
MYLSLLYIVLIVGANILASLWLLPLPFGMAVPAGVFLIAPIFTLRDRIQLDRGAKYVYILIFIGAIVSWLMGVLTDSHLLGRVAFAGVVAFVASESLDTMIFSYYKHSFVKRILVSNLFSTALDTILFIWIAFGWQTNLMTGQWILKMLLAAAVIPLIIPRKS